MIEKLPHGVPAADVRPAHVGRNDRRTARPFHERIVDRLLWRLCEGLRIEANEIEIARAGGNGLLRRGGNFRLEPGEFVEQDVGTKDKVAAVPEIILFEIARSLIGVWLFDE